MKWSDIADVIGTAAPVVGTLIGGPAGGAIGGLVASVLGVDAKPEAVSQALQDPAAIVKIRELELTHARELQALTIKAEADRLADVQDARARDIQVRQLSGGRNIRADVLAITAICGLIGLCAALLFVDIPDGPARDVLLLLAGGLLTLTKEVFSYEFGSSRGSAMKSEQLAKIKDAGGRG